MYYKSDELSNPYLASVQQRFYKSGIDRPVLDGTVYSVLKYDIFLFTIDIKFHFIEFGGISIKMIFQMSQLNFSPLQFHNFLQKPGAIVEYPTQLDTNLPKSNTPTDLSISGALGANSVTPFHTLFFLFFRFVISRCVLIKSMPKEHNKFFFD